MYKTNHILALIIYIILIIIGYGVSSNNILTVGANDNNIRRQRTFIISGSNGFDFTQIRKRLMNENFKEVLLESKPKYVDYIIMYRLDNNARFDTRLSKIKSHLINIIGNSRYSIADKKNLYKNLSQMPNAIQYLPLVIDANAQHDNITIEFPIILKPSDRTAFFGRDIIIVNSHTELDTAYKTLSKYPDVLITKYITNPLTRNGIKIHIRKYFIIYIDIDGPHFSYIKLGRIYTAQALFVVGDYDNPLIHITNSGGMTETLLYPEDMTGLNATIDIDAIETKIYAALFDAYLVAKDCGIKGSICSYELFGADILIDTYENIYLLEINTSVGVTVPVHDAKSARYFAELLDWIYNSTVAPAFSLPLVK